MALTFLGCGIVSAIGNNKKSIIHHCKNATNQPQFVQLPHSVEQPLPYNFINEGTDRTDANKLYDYIDEAVSAALQDAQLNQPQIERMGIFMGTSSNEIGVLEQQYVIDLETNSEPYPLVKNNFGELPAYIAKQFQITGPQYNFITACSSSANALIYAAQMLNSEKIDHALVIGVESYNAMSIYGFHAMMLLSSQQSRPFDRDRDGIVLGEGVGAVVLSRDDDTPSNYACKPTPYRYLAGANICDSNGVTASSPETIAQVMQQTLTRAGVSAKEISIIKAHGTSTVSNDTAEAQAMALTFANSIPPFTSLKPYLGHTMGACGIIELVTLLACLNGGFVPATPGFNAPDTTLPLSPLTENYAVDSGTILLNYFGFGGNNSSFIISNVI